MATTFPTPTDDPAPPAAPAVARGPKLADGIELIGEYEGSGFKEAPYIARRADGQVIQLTYLLYLVAEQCNGLRDRREIARRVSEAFGRKVSAGNVEVLTERKLRPLGVLADPDGSSPDVEKPDQLLALKFRTALVPERFTAVLTTVFKPLFLPPIVVAALATLIALDVWLFGIHGIGQGMREAIYQPWLLLVMFGTVVLATAFHETGHASACAYGGARPGVLGAGVYVVWPVFYCDVTDAYRLGKAGRLRTDLGGVYFNMIFALLTAGVYFVTGFEPLLLIILLQHFAIFQQLLPLLRLDGYYIVSDLTGVPDILNRIRPILRSLRPGRDPDAAVRELKPWVRVAVSAYVLTLVPLLLGGLTLMVISAPRLFATAYDSVGVLADKFSDAFGGGEVVTAAATGLQIFALMLPCAGMIATSGRIGRRLVGGALSWSEDDAVRRGGLGVVLAGGVAFAAVTWWPNGEYRPIQPSERVTLAGSVRAIADVPTGRPALTAEREADLGGAPTVRDNGGDFRQQPEPSDDGRAEEEDAKGDEETKDEKADEERTEDERSKDDDASENDPDGTTTAPPETSPEPPAQPAPAPPASATPPPEAGSETEPTPAPTPRQERTTTTPEPVP